MRLHLGGHLSWYEPQRRSWLDLAQEEKVSLLELALRLGVPAGEIALAVVNGRLVPLEQTLVSGDDRVELYPPMQGGSIDA